MALSRSLFGPVGVLALSAALVVTALGVSGAAATTRPANPGAKDASVSGGAVHRVQDARRSATTGFAGRLPTGVPESVIGKDSRKRVTDTTTFPARAIGQIDFVQDGSSYICTGWLIDANSILTSGHCSYTPDGNQGNIIEAAQFTAGRNGATEPFATCPVYQVYSPIEWRRDGSAEDDWSVMQLGTDPDTTCDIGNTVGWFGMSYRGGKNTLKGVKATVQGYPGDKKQGTQWTMKGKIVESTKTSVYYKMDTFGGQSGSPVFEPKGAKCGDTPCGMAVHSYGAGSAPSGGKANSGPRITKSRFNTITTYIAQNG